MSTADDPRSPSPAPLEFLEPASHGAGAQRATPLERVIIALVSLLLAGGLIALMSGFFAGRDQAGLGSSAAGAALGQSYPDLGDAHLQAGELRPAYDSDPPTSGAHVPLPVTHDQRVLSDDQLLQALSLGDIVVLYGTRRPPPGLVTLARSVAGRFSPALAAAGQAVVLGQQPGIHGLIGLAWTRMIRLSGPGDPSLRAFAEQWLGRGAR